MEIGTQLDEVTLSARNFEDAERVVDEILHLGMWVDAGIERLDRRLLRPGDIREIRVVERTAKD